MALTTLRGVPEPPDALHPIPIGTTVAVLGFDQTGCPYLEGYGEIRRHSPGVHRYLVNFFGEPPRVVRERFVHPEYQTDPDAYLAWMIEFWRASATPPITDFFPDEISTEPKETANGHA